MRSIPVPSFVALLCAVAVNSLVAQAEHPSVLRPFDIGHLQNGASKAPKVSPTAMDAKWSAYGPYLRRMAEAVQIQWERLILRLPDRPTGGSRVLVKFVMNDQGRISKIIGVESVDVPASAKRACVSAITDRAPYGPWTDDMKAVLGTQQELTFTFHFQ